MQVCARTAHEAELNRRVGELTSKTVREPVLDWYYHGIPPTCGPVQRLTLARKVYLVSQAGSKDLCPVLCYLCDILQGLSSDIWVAV